jgi:hypothetical protein
LPGREETILRRRLSRLGYTNFGCEKSIGKGRGAAGALKSEHHKKLTQPHRSAVDRI